MKHDPLEPDRDTFRERDAAGLCIDCGENPQPERRGEDGTLNRTGVCRTAFSLRADGAMSRLSRYSPEVRERAVRLVREHGVGAPVRVSSRDAVESIAGKLGCTAETLRKWVRQAERDNGLIRGGADDRAESQRVELSRPWSARCASMS